MHCFILRDLYKVVVEDLVEAGHCKLCFGKVRKPAAAEVIVQTLENQSVCQYGGSPLLAIVVPSSALVSWRFGWLDQRQQCLLQTR